MGDRVSISFKKGALESIALFDHWGGMKRVEEAQEYVRELKAEVGNRTGLPLDRPEPGTVMVDFIRHITKSKKRVNSGLYVGAMSDPMYGDNSDNGHHVISLD